MKQKRSHRAPGAMHTNVKRLLILLMLVIAAFLLSGCYVDPDRVVDDQNGLTLGTGGQQFDTIITPTPAVTATPTPTPASTSVSQDWGVWDFSGADKATDPPSNVIPIGSTTQPPVDASGNPVTTQPQSTISGSASTETMKSGSSGPEVTQLQNRLKELGYYTGTVDGKYGSGTVNAVRNFQAASNLTADGVAGPATQKAIYDYYAVKAADAKTTLQPTSKPTTKPGSTSSIKATVAPIVSGRTDIYLRLGDSGAQVKTMQNRLIALGYLSGTADSQFQEITEAAVIAFQKRNSLYSDGVAGPTTLSKLYSSTANKASSVVGNLGALKRGMNGAAVRSLQQLLKSLGFYNGSVDGDYGAGTEAAVIAFQNAHGLTADGVAGTSTMNAMLASSGTSGQGTSGGSGTNPATYGATAKSNGLATISATSGNKDNITALQSVLQSRNFYSGSLDGSYGTGTTSAVSAYQQAAGLRVTGMAGPTTQRLLYGGASETGTYTKLTLGSSGTAVRQLQYALYELMYYDGNITGSYDEATRNAVLTFQQVNGLAVDGVAGEGTQRRLYSSNAIPCNI